MPRKSRQQQPSAIIPLLEDDNDSTSSTLSQSQISDAERRNDGNNGDNSTREHNGRSSGGGEQFDTRDGTERIDSVVSGTNGEGDTLGDESFVAPSERGKRGSSAVNDSGESGSRGRGRKSNRSNASAASSSGSERAGEGSSSDSSRIPRQVAFESLSGSSSKKLEEQKLSREFFREGLQMGFSGIGSIVNDPEWALPDEDAEVLAERLHNWLRSLDKKKAAKWEKVVARWQPFLMLVFALVAIVIPRIAHTQQLKRNARNLRKENQGGNVSGAGDSSPVPAFSNHSPEPSGEGPGNATGNARNGNGHSGPPVFHTTRFSRQDLLNIDPQDDSPSM